MFFMTEPLADICKRLLYNANKCRKLQEQRDIFLYSKPTKQRNKLTYDSLVNLCYGVLGGKQVFIETNLINHAKNLQFHVADVMREEKSYLNTTLNVKTAHSHLKDLSNRGKYVKISTELYQTLLQIQKDLGKFRITIGA